MDYISVAQIAEKWDISVQRVRYYCRTSRIPGVQQVGRGYLIPIDAERPVDRRTKKAEWDNERQSKERVATKDSLSFTSVFDLVPIGIIVIERCADSYSIVYWNTQIETLTGSSNKKETELNVHPADKSKLYAALDKVYSQHTVQHIRFRYWTTATKKYLWIQMELKAVQLGAKTNYVIASVRNITKEYRMFEDLQLKTKLLKKAENNSMIHYMSYDIHSGTMFLDDQTRGNYKLKDNVLKNYPESSCRPDVVFPEDYQVLCHSFYMVLNGEAEELYFNLRTMSKKGCYAWRRIHFVGIYDKNQKLIYIKGTSVEIDSYIKLQQCYAQALEQNEIASWVFDAKLRKSNTYGITVDMDLYDSNHLIRYEFIHPDDRAAVRNLEDKLLFGTLQQSVQIRARKDTSEEFHLIKLMVTGMYEQDGQTIQNYLCTVKTV